MQPFEMGDQLRLTGPTAQGETEHFLGAFGWRAPAPQADQQAGDQGHIDLHPHTMGRLTQQVSAAQHTFDPPEKQLDVIVTSHKIRMVRPSRVFILQRTSVSPS